MIIVGLCVSLPAFPVSGFRSSELPGFPAPQLPSFSDLDPSSFDRSVRPQDDLFQFVNGSWIARAEIPAERVSSTTFTELTDQVERDLRRVIEDLQTRRRRPGSPEQQIVDLYISMRAEMLAWSHSRGIFAGIALNGATLREDTDENQILYGKKLSNREIVRGSIPVPKDAEGLMSALGKY